MTIVMVSRRNKTKMASAPTQVLKKVSNRTAAIDIPIVDILVDHKWNSRSGDIRMKGNEERTMFQGLVDSIKSSGQDEAVVVRPNPDPKGKQKYVLICGFRRFEAIVHIAVENEDKNPTIRAEIRNLSETEARRLNVRENTAREDFAIPDLAWAIADLGRQGLNDVGIAAEIGKTQGYVSKLHRIMKKGVDYILKDWRGSVAPLGVDEMLTVTESDDPKVQNELYKEKVERQVAKSTKPTDEEKDAKRLEGLKSKAFDFGYKLGEIDSQGYLDCSKLAFVDCIDLVVTFPSTGFDARRKRSVAAAAEKGYKQAFTDAAEAEEAAKQKAEKEKEATT